MGRKILQNRLILIKLATFNFQIQKNIKQGEDGRHIDILPSKYHIFASHLMRSLLECLVESMHITLEIPAYAAVFSAYRHGVMEITTGKRKN